MSDVAKALRERARELYDPTGDDYVVISTGLEMIDGLVPDLNALADYIEALEREIEIRRGSGLVSFEDWPDTDEAEARALEALEALIGGDDA